MGGNARAWISPDGLVGVCQSIDQGGGEESSEDEEEASVEEANAKLRRRGRNEAEYQSIDEGEDENSCEDEEEANAEEATANLRRKGWNEEGYQSIDQGGDEESSEDEEEESVEQGTAKFRRNEWNQEVIPPPFEPKDSDPYFKSRQVGQLITYLWHEHPEKIYRTGVLVSKDRIRFFQGHDEECFEDKFYLNQEIFKAKKFRVRTDLAIGS